MSDIEDEIAANEEALENVEVMSALTVAKFAEAQQRIAKQTRAEALEEAARLMEQIEAPGPSLAAEAIRALKDRKPC